jgi:hypothetical protein
MERKKERVFSVELQSKKHLKSLNLTNGTAYGVLFEGSIGELVHATFKEGLILEVIGKNGTLRVDLQETEISKPTEKTSEALSHD